MTFLVSADIPGQFWVDAAYTVVYTINRLPTPVLKGKSPHEKIYNKAPDYNFLCTFGSECFPDTTINPHTNWLLDRYAVYLLAMSVTTRVIVV